MGELLAANPPAVMHLRINSVMGESERKTIRNAKWRWIALSVLSVALAVNIGLDSTPEPKGAASMIIVLAGLAAVKDYFRYRKLKGQQGLRMIGDDEPLKNS